MGLQVVIGGNGGGGDYDDHHTTRWVLVCPMENGVNYINIPAYVHPRVLTWLEEALHTSRDNLFHLSWSVSAKKETATKQESCNLLLLLLQVCRRECVGISAHSFTIAFELAPRVPFGCCRIIAGEGMALHIDLAVNRMRRVTQNWPKETPEM